MPEAKVRGVTLNYQVVGNTGPWIEFTPGGRRGFEELVPFAERIASAGYRVLLHDRRNCGASDVGIEPLGSEHEIWADDLCALCRQVGATPIMAGGSSAAGGFVGINNGIIVQGFATGAVSVSGNDGFAGGFAGTNSGSITQAYATGAVTGGTGSVIGGFVGANNEGGSLEQTYAIGKLTGGGTVGGLAGTNDGTVNNSYWDTQTTGVSTSAAGTGLTTAAFIAALPPGFDTTVWGLQPNPSYPHFTWQPGGTVPIGPAPPPTPEQTPVIASQQQVIDNLVTTVTFASAKKLTAEVPAGAVSGPIAVHNSSAPAGTVKSAESFAVH